MTYSAHSPKNGYQYQPYEKHIIDVADMAKKYAQEVAKYSKSDGQLLLQHSEGSAYKHDLGKLERENQLVLTGKMTARKLPYHHQDAGAAYLLTNEHLCPISAVAISSHHYGLPDFAAEQNRQENMFRDKEFQEKTDEILPELIKIHESLISTELSVTNDMPRGDLSVFLRILLSCLVDADHTDTARHYGRYPEIESAPELKPAERLAALGTFVANLDKEEKEVDEQRNVLRKEMYEACRNTRTSSTISSCDSPVGSGKTTAVMAHLLTQAKERGLRRIFVVLPYTNIIQQSVETYRKALVLTGEDPNDVVAELHHRADFESEDARHLSALWRAPIIVTTAVAFFETMASNLPATLRRLHELPGSAIFVDESHATLPVKLLPIAWRWMNIFADEWSCYWVLASGSLCRFWQIAEIAQNTTHKAVPEIVSDDLRSRLEVYERNRVSYKSDLNSKRISELIELINDSPGPRLVILNTVQSAAVLAYAYSERFGRECTEHLSTALTPNDRDRTLGRIKERLKNKNDVNWTLFATSCVEAGVNLSFRRGFREIGSLVSLLQLAGRVNREGDYPDAEVWTFILEKDDMIIKNTGLNDAADILRGYFEKNMEISPDLSTRSVSSEIRLHGVSGEYAKLLNDESIKDFPSVQKNFTVIESDTSIAVVDSDVAELIRKNKIDWKLLQRNSVQIKKYKLKGVRAEEIFTDIYHWKLGYNDFLGYMAGIIENNMYKSGIVIV